MTPFDVNGAFVLSVTAAAAVVVVTVTARALRADIAAGVRMAELAAHARRPCGCDCPSCGVCRACKACDCPDAIADPDATAEHTPLAPDA